MHLDIRLLPCLVFNIGKWVISFHPRAIPKTSKFLDFNQGLLLGNYLEIATSLKSLTTWSRQFSVLFNMWYFWYVGMLCCLLVHMGFALVKQNPRLLMEPSLVSRYCLACPFCYYSSPPLPTSRLTISALVLISRLRHWCLKVIETSLTPMLMAFSPCLFTQEHQNPWSWPLAQGPSH